MANYSVIVAQSSVSRCQGTSHQRRSKDDAFDLDTWFRSSDLKTIGIQQLFSVRLVADV
jgi:hypothetical protein